MVQTDGESARTAAVALVKLTESNADEMLTKIRLDAEYIANSKETSHQRDRFNPLSENMYALVKATQANESPLYRQYCPMAMDNQGAYWLSAEKEVYNPYFGDKMLHCGSVKEEL